MSVTAPAAVVLALALDLAVAEPPVRVHPVALFGRVVAPLDREWARPRAVGAVAALALPLVAALAAGGVVLAGTRFDPWAGAALAGGVLFSTTSLRMLVGVAREVVDASREDPSRARERARALVGRETADLSPGEVRSAAVESAAENLADGLVAPLSAFALLATVSPALGAAAAAWVKAVNTMDSMLGYRDKPVGTASARLDDAVMWLPARASAALIAAASLAPGAVGRARPLSRTPDSPNSGWPMATLAVALGVRLAKPGAYDIDAGATLPSPDEARRGVRTVALAGGLAYLLAAAVVALPLPAADGWIQALPVDGRIPGVVG